ncbi:hypothetical protein [Erythrobacter sp. THAF29]|uniref:hypothetical protein n=1 Tax=Erythrobacter sp. THAF29 TaxID=2587851 RepID=UPI0012686FF1|nr:hypothetical protein [Erythrobacter sp. THAF29]QFT77793.1 hypothetical protein FIU90_09625 [Erythrobacter sp. THAF29]
MNVTFSRVAVAAAVFLAVPAMADEPEAKTPETEQEAKPEKGVAAPAAPEAKEEKRICRRVKLDMSSRRGTKVCKTADEWRQFNQRR